MLAPLSIDIYLSALLVISTQFGVPADNMQIALSTYVLGFILGQLIYGPMADSFRHRSVALGGTLVFAIATVARALAQAIDQLTVMRFFHGLVAAATDVVINALVRNIYPKEGFSWIMSFVILVMTIAPLMVPIANDQMPVWLGWHYIFWTLAVTMILASTMIFLLAKGILSPERRRPSHIRTTIGSSVVLFRHKCVLSYIPISGFNFAGMFSFLSAGPFVYTEISHIAPESSDYYFAPNILFLSVMTIFSNRFVRRIGVLDMFRSELWIQLIMAAWMVIDVLLGLRFWPLAVGVAVFVSCVSVASSNAMAVILNELPHMVGTISSLAGIFRFGIGAIVDALFSFATFNSIWPMTWSIAFCATSFILFYLYVSRPKKW